MTAMTQKQIMYAVHRYHADAVNLFAEIQNGPRPLTADEIRRMKALRPGQYDWLPEDGRQD